MAVIENHNGDSLANVYSNARNTYNGVTAFPTTKFDGVLSHVGGGSTSLYSLFLTKVNQRNAVMSDFTIDLQFEHLTGEDYHATVTIDNVGGYTGTNLVLQVVVTESNLDINWGIGDDVNSVNRLMVPNQNGTPLDFSGSSTQTVELDFTMQGYWDEDNCELIAFVQDNSTKEVLQGTLKTMAIAEFNLDAELNSVSNIPASLCLGEVAPVVKIKNKGAEVLTSLNINFEVNGNMVYTYPWEGELEFPFMETVEIPAFTFFAMEENEIVVSVSDPNNGTDQNPDNNEISLELDATPQCTDFLALVLKLDASPGETTWECIDPDGEVVKTGGPYTQAYLLVKDTVFYEKMGCYQFILYDAGGNGLSTYYSLRSVVDGDIVVIHNGGTFGASEETQLTALMDGVQAGFTSDVQAGCPGLTVEFTDMSMGPVTEWNWAFEGGDPATSTDQNPTVYYADAGDYNVSLTVSDGTNTDTYDFENYITVFELPEVTMASIEDQCLQWPAWQLTQGSPEGGEYAGPGVEDGWFSPDLAGLGTHTISYTYTDGNGCENTAQVDVFVDACTGIVDLSSGKVLSIYPNPVTSVSTIEFYLNENSDVTISIYNSVGMMVKELANDTFSAGVNQVQINTRGFENGIYFVSFSDGNNVVTRKMTIVK